jgi:hypothetical protein
MTTAKIKKKLVLDIDDPIQKLLREIRIMPDEKVGLDKQLLTIFLFQVKQLHYTSSGSQFYYQGPDNE